MSISLIVKCGCMASAIRITTILSLAAVVQWIKYRPVDQRVIGLIPSQGTCLGCWSGPQ